MPVGNFNVCLEQADAFYRVAENICQDSNDFFTPQLYPYVVNMSFSCELYMKAIMIHESGNDTFSAGHNLETLFQKLPIAIQTKIELLYKKDSSKALTDFLHEYGNSFMDWRYAFENGVSIDTTSLLAFASALKQYTNSLH